MNGNVTTYLVDGVVGLSAVVEERDGYVGSLSARYEVGVERIGQVRSGVSSYYIQGGLGSVVALADSSGNVTSYGYNAFGTLAP